MKRKNYKKPTMKVVKVEHRGLLMASGQAGVEDYTEQKEQEW